MTPRLGPCGKTGILFAKRNKHVVLLPLNTTGCVKLDIIQKQCGEPGLQLNLSQFSAYLDFGRYNNNEWRKNMTTRTQRTKKLSGG